MWIWLLVIWVMSLPEISTVIEPFSSWRRVMPSPLLTLPAAVLPSMSLLVIVALVWPPSLLTRMPSNCVLVIVLPVIR